MDHDSLDDPCIVSCDLPAYELGSRVLVRHALPPQGVVDGRGFRQALCGAWARPSGRVFGPAHPDACRSCKQIVAKRPPVHAVNPSVELALLRHLLALGESDGGGNGENAMSADDLVQALRRALEISG